MRYSNGRLLLALTLAAVRGPCGGRAEGEAEPDQDQYVAPKNPAHQPIYDRLKQVRFLEQAQEFLSPFRLPRTLLMKTEGCDGESNAWYENDAITLCYEYIEEMWRNAPTRNDAGRRHAGRCAGRARVRHRAA